MSNESENNSTAGRITRDNAAGGHSKKQRPTGGVGEIMVQLCFAAALLILPYSQEIQLNSLQQSPPPQQQMVVSDQLQLVSLQAFQLAQVFFILGFSTSLGGISLPFYYYPFTTQVLEATGTVFGVLGFFLSMGIVVDIYFKSLLWVIWFTGAMTLVFILVNTVHELRALASSSSSSSDPPILPIHGGSTRDVAAGGHSKKRRRTGGVGEIMVQLCLAAALLILPYSQQIQLNSLQQSPPPSPQQQQQMVSDQLQIYLPAFQLAQVFFILGFSTSLGGISLPLYYYPFTAQVLETTGTVFGVLGFFLSMGIVVDIYFKSLLWVIWFTGAMTLVFILVNAVHA